LHGSTSKTKHVIYSTISKHRAGDDGVKRSDVNLKTGAFCLWFGESSVSRKYVS